MMKKLYNLFLDDVRFPKQTFEYMKNPIYVAEEWEIVRSYNEFVKIVSERGTPYMVSFDHDLADAHYHESMYQDGKVYMKYIETTSEKTGHDCAKWLVDYCIDTKSEFPMWYIHSMNPVGSENIKGYIKSYLRSLESNCGCNNNCACEK